LAVLPAFAQAPRAPYQTTKVEGTDNVYIFRAGGHQSMFVVTKDGVIATDPIGYGRPQMVRTYVEEIRKVTDKPIKYLVYSHHHNDHISGGKPTKDRIEAQNDPEMVPPDEVFQKHRTLRLGGTALELTYVGLNHSDSTIVMRLPKEKILFAVDFLPVGQVPGRGMIDFYPLEVEDSIKQVLAMDWDKLIPGHPGPGDRLGTKQDVRDQLDFLRYASETVKAAARDGKCWDQAEKEVKLPKYEKWPGYDNNLPFVIRRYCGLWGRGT
jgi:glyoxylase-like metal-dependent hydrolase (beta-lactamase superfamily II)